MITIDSIKTSLKNNGYKLTKQRKSIIEVLTENSGNFLSAEDIYIKSKEKCSKTNLSTVYRNLQILENINIIHKTLINGSSVFYKLICDKFHHHHLICKCCGKTEIINFCPIQNMKLSNNDFTITDHKLELYGYCKECTKKLKTK